MALRITKEPGDENYLDPRGYCCDRRNIRRLGDEKWIVLRATKECSDGA